MLEVIALALLPIIVLIYYVYQQDEAQREPARMIILGFLLGCLSAPGSFLISVPSEHIGLYTENVRSTWDAFRVAFFGAAIPEETAKLFFLWLLLRKNRFFDERVDGIVYAVSVGMGFAAVENMLYLFDAGETWVDTGVVRAVLSVPGHFSYAVLMGYYYSLHHFNKSRFRAAGLKLWLYPVLAHGIYDLICFVGDVHGDLFGVLTIILLLFCFMVARLAVRSMKKHLIADVSESSFVDNVDVQE